MILYSICNIPLILIIQLLLHSRFIFLLMKIYIPVSTAVTANSGAGTHLKVKGTDSARKCGHHRTSPAQSAGFFCRAPPLFGSKSTFSRFGERFRDGQYSFVSFLFAVLLLTVSVSPVPSYL